MTTFTAVARIVAEMAPEWKHGASLKIWGVQATSLLLVYKHPIIIPRQHMQMIGSRGGQAQGKRLAYVVRMQR